MSSRVCRALVGLGMVATSLTAALLPASAQTAPSAMQPPNVPDIAGPWQIDGPHPMLMDEGGKAPPLLPKARKAYAEHQAMRKAGELDFDNITRCVPPGVPRIMTVERPFRIVQGQRRYVMLFEWNHMSRVIFMDRGHFEGIGALYLGQSVGKWDGDTLVVDTDSYKDATILDDAGIPHSDQLHTVERIRVADGGNTLRNRITITDPKTFSRPWTVVLQFTRRPGTLIKEDYCLGRMGLGVSKAK